MLTLMFALSAAAHAQDEAFRKAVESSRPVAVQVIQEYRIRLTRELQLSGPLRAFLVCKYTCPEITSSQSRKTGWSISMVSLRPRNPALATANVWEQQVVANFEKRLAKNERSETLEFAEIVTEPQGRFFRYARAIVMEQVCLACHGPTEKLADAVKAQLAADYPFDKATGYSAGQLYGVVSIKRPY